MRKIYLAYGRGDLAAEISDDIPVEIISPSSIQPSHSPAYVVNHAIENPVGDICMEKLSKDINVSIAINDKTRPVPHEYLLPPLLDFLHKAGVSDHNVTFIIATGTHLPMKPHEFTKILPRDIVDRFNVISHDCDDDSQLIDIGITSYNTRVQVNKHFYNSSMKIVVGNLEPHHFAGYSGGYKTASIGLTSRRTINENHAHLLNPLSKAGNYQNNPLRQDIEEIGRAIGVDLALNAILNHEKQIVDVVFGTPKAVIQAGIPITNKICQTPVKQSFDIVIASCAGYPKDINLYQAQKGLTHAAMITRDGGTVILVAECEEGVGSASYENFMVDVKTPQQVFDKFQKEGFLVGPHKAIQFAMASSRINVILVSSINSEKVQRLLLTPSPTLVDAIRVALKTAPMNPRIAIMPSATNTVPYIPGE